MTAKPRGRTRAHAPVVERLFRLSERDPLTGCWVWQGNKLPTGYGIIGVDGGTVRAHRAAYEIMVEPIPAGLVIDHLCRNRSCINPAHLEPVTQRENNARSQSVSALNAAKTHCIRGHLFDEANTYITKGGARSCRTCNAAKLREMRATKRLAADDPRHGTLSAYTSYRCRCDACSAAQRAYRRRAA